MLRSCDYDITFLKSLEFSDFAELDNFFNLLTIKLEKFLSSKSLLLPDFAN